MFAKDYRLHLSNENYKHAIKYKLYSVILSIYCHQLLVTFRKHKLKRTDFSMIKCSMIKTKRFLN